MSNSRLIIFCIFISSSFINAQTEAHYWTHQYGAKGLLLNGAVIASSDDETSLFYNPGSIGMDDNLGFAFSFLSPTYSSLTVNNFIGDNNRIKDDGLDFSPGFLAVRFRPFKTDKIAAGITGFKRFKSDIKFKDRVVDQVNSNEITLFRGDLDFKRRVSEDWYGFGMSYNPIKNLGFGFTHFLVFNNEQLDFNLKKEIFFSSNLVNPLFSWRSEFGYSLSSLLGMVTKLGLSYRSHKFSAGFTYTSPVFFRARTSGSYFIEDLRVDNVNGLSSSSGNRKSVEIQNLETPHAFGFGIDCLFSNTRVSISSEYFTQISRHTIFEDINDSFDGLGMEPSETMISLKSQNSRVINAAVGIQHYVDDRKTILAGFRTDFDQGNSLLINDTSEYLGSTGNIFHFSGGGMFRYGKNLFSIGIDIGIGANEGGNQLVDLSNITEQNIFSFSGDDSVSSNFSSIMLFITYDFIFKNVGMQNETENLPEVSQ